MGGVTGVVKWSASGWRVYDFWCEAFSVLCFELKVKVKRVRVGLWLSRKKVLIIYRFLLGDLMMFRYRNKGIQIF